MEPVGPVNVINYLSEESIYTNAIFGFPISKQGFAHVTFQSQLHSNLPPIPARRCDACGEAQRRRTPYLLGDAHELELMRLETDLCILFCDPTVVSVFTFFLVSVVRFLRLSNDTNLTRHRVVVSVPQVTRVSICDTVGSDLREDA